VLSVATRITVLVLATCLLAASAERSAVLPHQAYVWQRHWTPALVAAVTQSADLVAGWHVLAAEAEASGQIRDVAADRAALARTGRPVTLVLRIDGQLAHWDEATLLADLHRLVEDWRAGSVALAGVEIDHDCGTARLGTYAQFLGRVRAMLGPALPLSITALPAWLASPDLDAVLDAADETVLQLHAVQSPHQGLFDPEQARRWVERYAGRTTKLFRVALPAYGSRVSWRADGSILAIDSEAPRLAGGYAAAELIAPPRDVARLLRRLERDPPPGLVGVVWFRLPMAADRRAWSLATWRSVVRGEAWDDRIELRADGSAIPGMRNLVLVNAGTNDAELPRLIELPASCRLADGINGYALSAQSGGLALRRAEAGLLPGGQHRIIGWARCAPRAGEIHVRP
jgi:hypothetical protein